MPAVDVIHAINNSPLNRGLRGEDWVSDPNNIAIEFGSNIALFDGMGDGSYQVHFLFETGGPQAVANAKAAFTQMFCEYKAELIFGLVPDFLPRAKKLARLADGVLVGKRMTADGPCELYVLSRELWKGECP